MRLPLLLAAPAALVLIALLSACRDQARIDALEQHVRALEKAHQESRADLEEAKAQMREVQEQRNQMRDERDRFKDQLEENKRRLQELEKAFSDYKEKYKVAIRDRAPGMEFPQLKAGLRTYEKVRIRELTATSLTFLHQTGTASVPLTDLPEPMQQLFGHDP